MESKVASTLSLDAAEVADLLSTLPGNCGGIKDAFQLTLNNAEWAQIGAIRNAVAYQGFDPFKIISEFLEKSRANIPAVGVLPQTITVGDDKFAVYEGTHASTDLVFLLTLFLTRGNNVAKILLKCDPAVSATITRKCNQYGISTVSKQTTGPLGPKVITLARLSQAFAPATASIILGHSITGNLRSKLFCGMTLPHIMTHTIFPGLLRTTDIELIEIAKILNLEMSIMLATPKEKRRMESQTLSDLIEKSSTFVTAAVNGGVITDSVKFKILQKAGLVNESGNPSMVVMTMSGIVSRLSSMGYETYTSAVRRLQALIHQTESQEKKKKEVDKKEIKEQEDSGKSDPNV